MPAKPKLYYNSACPVCRTGIEQQRARMDQKLPEGSDSIAWCDIAATNAVPLVMTLTVRETAVLDSHTLAESRTKHGGNRWRQGNLFHRAGLALGSACIRGRVCRPCT